MEYRKLGQSGIDASVIGLGTWAIGGWMWGGTDEQDSIRAIHASIDAGVNLIDTAPAYGQGRSEQIVGQAIADRRDKVILATKCGLRWDSTQGKFHFTDPEGRDIYKNNRPEGIREELTQSLKRLGVETIDLYQTHWQDPTTPIEDTMECLMKLKEEGKIRAIGVSNASVEDMKQYQKVGPIDVDQEKYNMIDRKLEAEQLPFCREHNIAVLAYSPMAMGLLTGKVTPDRQFPPTDVRSKQPRFSVENRQRVQKLLEQIKPIADAHDIELAQLAVAWTLHQPGLTHALVGARKPEQATANLKAGDVKLTPEELDQIQAALDQYGKNIE